MDSGCFPATTSAALETIGKFKNGPIIGIFLKNAKAIGNKAPNKFKKPKISQNIPVFVSKLIFFFFINLLIIKQ